MELERVRAELRPRRYPEAIDLGFRMARRWWAPMAASWALTVAPMLGLAMLTAWNKPVLALVLLWWLEPLLERMPLHILSRALFGDRPSVREALRRAPGLFFRRDALLALTVFRFDPVRALRLPVWQLEGLRGRPLRERSRVLLRGVGNWAFGLTAMCWLFEWCLTIVPWVLLPLLYPGVDPNRWFARIETVGIEAIGLPWQWAFVVSWAVAAAVIGPFHVGGGFALYLNRRTHLEAWDVEVAFRRMARRIGGAATAALLAGSLLLPGPARAEPGQEGQEGQEGDDPQETIREILADPVFGYEETESVWTFDPDSAGGERPEGAILGGALAVLLTPLLWLVVVVGMALLLVQIVLQATRGGGGAGAAGEGETEALPPPRRLFGLDVREESLPADVVAAARRSWDAGDSRAAVGLLYRAAVARLIADGLKLKESATEGDCLRLASAALPADRLAYLRALTVSWQSTAYGHRPPPADTAESLMSRWDAHFGAAA